MILYDYYCESCEHFFERLDHKDVIVQPCPACGGSCSRAMPAPMMGTVWGAAESRGSREGPPDPRMMDTRAIADGKMDVKEWRKERRKMWRDEDRKENGTYGQRKVFY